MLTAERLDFRKKVLEQYDGIALNECFINRIVWLLQRADEADALEEKVKDLTDIKDRIYEEHHALIRKIKNTNHKDS